MSDLISEQKTIAIPVGREIARSPGRTGASELHPPRTREDLGEFVRHYFRLIVPDRSVCPHHDSPLDYLSASFFGQEDLLVWANRGGGKTLLAAVATILDALFHPPVRIRVLGGSFDQSDRLAEYIRAILSDNPQLVVGRATRERIRLIGGSDIQMLPQSEMAVRGQHVQKVRCDEVDLFDPEVWRAVQFTTRSRGSARGSIEVLSTLHRPGGLMQDLVDSARRGPEQKEGYHLICWCLWDVIERCGPERACETCPLADDCRGIARNASGFFGIDDAIAVRARSSKAAWETEMLCLGPQRELAVFGEFDLARHVRAVTYQPDFPTYRAIDFGYRNPFVCLWIQITPGGGVHVLGEYIRSHRPITHHAAEILKRDPGPVVMTYVDPAGRQKESTSGAACTELLAAAGISCNWRGSTVTEGLELIRAALDPADGKATMTIHPACLGLIDAFLNYHYARTDRGGKDTPVKDGPDHPIDALRYFFVNRMRPRMAVRRATY